MIIDSQTQKAKKATQALARVSHWRTVLVGRIMGTVAAGEPPVDGMRDLFTQVLMLRVECNALTRLLIEAGVITEDRVHEVMVEECDAYNELMAKKFPGFRATDLGLDMDIEKAKATMKGWPA